MCEVRSKLLANHFCVILYLYINLYPLFYYLLVSIFCYISHHFPSLVTPYLSYLDIFLTARNYAIFLYFLCIIIFLCQFT